MTKANGLVHFLRSKKKNQIRTVATASNGRILYPTESFTQKPSAFTNVKSVMKLFGGKEVYVQDNTVTPALVYRVTPKGKTLVNMKPTKKIPK